MTGLFVSYYLNVAPGGFTALVSVAVLVIVLAGKVAQAKARGAQREKQPGQVQMLPASKSCRLIERGD